MKIPSLWPHHHASTLSRYIFKISIASNRLRGCKTADNNFGKYVVQELSLPFSLSNILRVYERECGCFELNLDVISAMQDFLKPVLLEQLWVSWIDNALKTPKKINISKIS